ncbi:MAG: hypothetical protein R6U94_05595 [Nitriliruptoraceae bacterium]
MSTPRLLVASLLLTAAALLLGCGTGGEEDGAEVGDEQGEEGVAGGGAEASDSREVTLAIADAAERTGLAEDDIEVEDLSMVTWSDGALGCPEPDVMYTQALVEGYRIVLDADGRQLVYHGALGDDPFLCEDPQEPLEDQG